MLQFGGFGMGMGMNDVASSQKEIIRLKGAVLYPPPPSMYIITFYNLPYD